MLFYKLKDKEQDLNQHLVTFRKNIIVFACYFFTIFGLVFYYSNYWYRIITAPLNSILIKFSIPKALITTSLPESFFTYLKLSFFITIFCLLPIISLQIILYLRPIFKSKKDKIALFTLGIGSIILFYIGAAMAYFLAFNMIFKFFINYAITRDIGLYLKISSYTSFAIGITFWLGLIFELPIVLIALYKLKLVTYKGFKKFRKYAILIAFIIAAIITPPDPFSQIIVAVILIALYEITLLIIAKFLSKT